MTPEEAVDSADRQVYALVAERRAEMFDEVDGFSIAAPSNSLRQRLLNGEMGALDAVVALNLEDCLEIASENNRQYQSQRESLFLAALDLTLERWRFGWQPTVGAGASANGTVDGDSGSVGVDGGASLSRLFGNGGRLLLNFGTGLFRAIANGDGWDAVSDFSVSWTQPLLRGSAREVVLEPLTQAERNLVYSVRNFERFRRTFALDVANRYYNLALTRQNVLNERANVEVLDLLSRRNKAFAEAGKLSDLEASEAEQDLISSQNRLLSLEANFQSQLDSFKFFLGLPIEVQIGIDPEGLNQLGIGNQVAVEEIDQQQLFQLALQQRLDYLNEVERLVDSERRARIAADDLKMGLDLSAGLNGGSEEGRPLAYRSDGSTWNIGLDLDLPVDQLPERNSYRRALISLQSAQRDLIEFQDSIHADIRDALRELELAELTYELQKQTVELNERRAKNANMNLEAGRLDTESFLRAQRDLTAGRNAFVAASVDYTLARLQLFQNLELLTVSETGLTIDWDALPASAMPEAPEQDSQANEEDGE